MRLRRAGGCAATVPRSADRSSVDSRRRHHQPFSAASGSRSDGQRRAGTARSAVVNLARLTAGTRTMACVRPRGRSACAPASVGREPSSGCRSATVSQEPRSRRSCNPTVRRRAASGRLRSRKQRASSDPRRYLESRTRSRKARTVQLWRPQQKMLGSQMLHRRPTSPTAGTSPARPPRPRTSRAGRSSRHRSRARAPV